MPVELARNHLKYTMSDSWHQLTDLNMDHTLKLTEFCAITVSSIERQLLNAEGASLSYILGNIFMAKSEEEMSIASLKLDL